MFYPLIGFILIFLSHSIYSILKMMKISQKWVQIGDINSLSLYFKQQDFFLSFSYALTVAFTIYAILKFQENRKSGVVGIVSGITLISVFYIGGCFLLGCCGSPMLAVYLSVFGSSFLGFTKPVIAIMTTLSVIIGYFWIEKKSKGCCEGNRGCLD